MQDGDLTQRIGDLAVQHHAQGFGKRHDAMFELFCAFRVCFALDQIRRQIVIRNLIGNGIRQMRRAERRLRSDGCHRSVHSPRRQGRSAACRVPGVCSRPNPGPGADDGPAQVLQQCPDNTEAYISATLDLKQVRQRRAFSRNFQQRRPELYQDLSGPLPDARRKECAD